MVEARRARLPVSAARTQSAQCNTPGVDIESGSSVSHAVVVERALIDALSRLKDNGPERMKPS